MRSRRRELLVVALMLVSALGLRVARSSEPPSAALLGPPEDPRGLAVQLAARHIAARNASFIGGQAPALPHELRLDLRMVTTAAAHGSSSSSGSSSEALAEALGSVAGDGSIQGVVATGLPDLSGQLAMFSTAMQLPVVSSEPLPTAAGGLPRPYPFFHSTAPSDRSVADALIRILMGFGRERIAVIHDEATRSHALAAAVQQAGHDLGAVVTAVGFELEGRSGDDTGPLKAAAEVSGGGYQQVVCVATPAGEAAAVNSALELGVWDDPAGPGWVFAGGAGVLAAAAGGLTGGLADAVAAQRVLRFRSDLAAPGTALVREVGGAEGEAAAAFAYDAAWALGFAMALAAEQAPEPPPGARALARAANDALRNVSFTGASGVVRFGPGGERDPATLGWALDLAVSSPSSSSSLPGGTVAWERAATLESGDERVTGALPPLAASEPWPAFPGQIPVAGPGGPECPEGMSLAASGLCAFRVAIILPYVEGLAPALWALAALEGVRAVNARDEALVGTAAVARLPPSTAIEPLLIGYDGTAAGAMAAGLAALEAGAVAVVGAGSEEPTHAILPLMDAASIPLVSFSATSNALSSSSLFTRVVPSDRDIAEAAAELALLNFGWRRVGVIFEANVHGDALFHEFEQAFASIGRAMKPPAEFQLVGGALSLTRRCESSTLETLARLKKAGIRAFIVSVSNDCLPNLLWALLELDMLGPGHALVFLGQDATRVLDDPGMFNISSSEALELRPMLDGLMSLRLNPFPSEDLENQSQSFTSSVLQILRRDGALPVPPELTRLLPPGLESGSFPPEVLSHTALGAFAYDAIWLVALGLSEAEPEVPVDICGDQPAACRGADLAANIRKQAFVGITGEVWFTDSANSTIEGHAHGDRVPSDMMLRLELFDADVGNWTRVGSVRLGSDALGNVELYRAAEAIALTNDGSQCPPGWYFNAETLECAQCEPGTFNPLPGSSVCLPCIPGEFCNHRGCKSCTECSAQSWQDESGASECNACPKNTHTGTSGAKVRELCVCQFGFYRRDGRPGRECFGCPSGGICLGGSQPPFADQGTYGNWSLVDTTVEDSTEAAKELQSTLFRNCSITEHCTNKQQTCEAPAEADVGELTAVAVAEEGSVSSEDLCRADAAALCKEGFTGSMCQQCQLGYFRLSGSCLPCQSPAWLFTVGCILVVILVWYLINRVAAGRYEAVDLLLLYLQNASTISFYSLNWSQELQTGLFMWLSIVNFDVTFITPDCLSTQSYTAWSYGGSLGLQLGLPVLILTFSAALLFFNYIMLKISQAPTLRGRYDSADNALVQKTPSLPTRAFDMLVKVAGFAANKKEFAKLVDRSISDSLTVLNLLYHTLTAKCLEVFMCFKVADGSYRLTASPDVPCWEGPHLRFVGLSVTGLIVYTLCIPIAFLLILEYGRVYNLFRNQQYMARFGWLYLRYERSFYFWELAILFRRGMLVVVLVLCQALSGVQIALGFTIVVASMTMHFYAQPFISDSLDALEMFSLISLAGLLCSGVLFFDRTALEAISGWKTLATCLTWLSVGGCLILVIFMVMQDVRYEESTKRVSRHMRAALQMVLDLYSPLGNDPLWGEDDQRRRAPKQRNSMAQELMKTLVNSFSVFTKSNIITPIKAAEEDIEAVAAGEDPRGRKSKPKPRQIPRAHRVAMYDRWSKLCDLINAEDLELHRTLDIGHVRTWFDRLMMDVDLSGKKHPKAEQPETETTAQYIHRSFTGASMRALTGHIVDQNMPPQAQLGTIRFWMANHWMKNIMADTSPVSFYSTRPYSMFFGNLVSENPYLIDHILHSSEEDLHRAKDVINDLRAAQLRYTKNGRLAGLVSDIDKGPLLAWLMVASHSHKEIIKELLVEMYKAKNNGKDPAQVEADVGETGYKGFMDKLIHRLFPKGGTTTGLSRLGAVPLKRQNTSLKVRNSPTSAFSAFQVPTQYRNTLSSSAGDAVASLGSFFSRIRNGSARQLLSLDPSPSLDVESLQSHNEEQHPPGTSLETIGKQEDGTFSWFKVVSNSLSSPTVSRDLGGESELVHRNSAPKAPDDSGPLPSVPGALKEDSPNTPGASPSNKDIQSVVDDSSRWSEATFNSSTKILRKRSSGMSSDYTLPQQPRTSQDEGEGGELEQQATTLLRGALPIDNGGISDEASSSGSQPRFLKGSLPRMEADAKRGRQKTSVTSSGIEIEEAALESKQGSTLPPVVANEDRPKPRHSRLRVEIGTSDEESCASRQSFEDATRLSPLAGGKMLNHITSGARRTIQAEILRYSMDEEVSRKFNIQRFDEEIQRLSNFSSPIEGWLNDLEQRIAERSGRETSLATLVDKSLRGSFLTGSHGGTPGVSRGSTLSAVSQPLSQIIDRPTWEEELSRGESLALSSMDGQLLFKQRFNSHSSHNETADRGSDADRSSSDDDESPGADPAAHKPDLAHDAGGSDHAVSDRPLKKMPARLEGGGGS